MKRALLALFCLLVLCAARSQPVDITGTWKEFQMTYKSAGGSETMTEDQMKAQGLSTEFSFMESGKFSQTSNMSGSGTMDTYEGTWKMENNKVIIKLKIGEKEMEIPWDFEYKDNVMNLSRSNPDGTFTIVNSFRRK